MGSAPSPSSASPAYPALRPYAPADLPAVLALLGSALDALCGLGAAQAVLYVDDDETPGGERDRTAADRLYEPAGFEEVDQLWS
ncbi:hypothetical protein TK78_13445 [Streptomyces sp. Tue 6075]|uniref:hypothetical protein n=1 Tax=Streptomyces sp. Tue 6075 TaxID=1661694 RepID=UPI00094A6486|nr:hypothetical protein [Streptomyces sp. Tue 6075]APS19857.1 hypothetical protein TK78_13445 [Streptomyces sp. Tue 6075]